MLGVVASDGKVMPPLWIDCNAKVDTAVYIEQLKKVKKWLDETYGDHTPWVFMQDGAPSHTSEQTQTWLKENFGEDRFWPESMWPPYSPDLNPLDYNVWGYVESKACAMPQPLVLGVGEPALQPRLSILLHHMFDIFFTIASLCVPKRGTSFTP